MDLNSVWALRPDHDSSLNCLVWESSAVATTMKKVKIQDDAGLAYCVEHASALIQAIHDYAGRDFTKKWKLRFPRGYVRTAQEQRQRLSFIPDGPLKDNIAYTLILADTTHWLLCRTDVTHTIQEQLIKLHLFLLGALVESITKVYLSGKCGKSYKIRTEYLVTHHHITPKLKIDLDWLWDMRNNMHLFLVPNSEYSCPDYTVANYSRGVAAFRELVNGLA